MNSQIPPQDLEAEASVVGAMVIEPKIISEIASILDPRDFYRNSHRQVYEAILGLWNRGEPVDLVMLIGELRDRVLGADVAKMAENALPTSATGYARTIKEKAKRRRLLEILRQATEDLHESRDDSLTIAGRLTSCVSSLTEKEICGFVPLSDAVTSAIKAVEKALQQGNPVVGIPSGLRDLDTRLGGISRGDLWIIAGRPSMGKTSLAVTYALGAAERGYGVCFVSAESPTVKIALRIIAKTSGVESRQLRRGHVSDEEIINIVECGCRLGDLPFWLLDRERNWDRIKARIRALKIREPKLALVVIDYIGLISAYVPGSERYQQIGRISSELKALAIELDLGVLLLSQLNRQPENRSDNRPKLSDLRESGDLEQDADLVGLLFRPTYYQAKGHPEDLAEFDIAKNRDGATGLVNLRFNSETVSFHDWLEPSPGRDFTE